MRASCLLALALATTAFSATASASTMYAINHMGNHPDTQGPDTLIVFDTTDPAGYTTLGFMDVPNVGFGGLDFDAEGNLWAYATFIKVTGGAKAGLYSVNPDTGETVVQGTLSTQTLTDLAFNPVDNTMYGVFSQGYATTRLYSVDLLTGDVTAVGTFTGLEDTHNIVGFGIDSTGAYYLHDNINNNIYRADGFTAELLYSSDLVSVGSQGLTIDWANGDVGYHATIGQGDFPDYYNNLNTFALDGSNYVWGPDWGDNYSDGLPQVQPGDVAILIPTPGSFLSLLALSAAARRRR
ncbi:MAG: hypothetical protein ACF8NJ_04505 [Phycisphaerales bacterium JB038]